MKVIAYYRTSTKEQNYGIDAQRKDVRAMAEAKGFEIVAEYEEHMSGKRNDRPALAHAANEAKNMGASIIVAKVDRLTRDLRFAVNFIHANEVIFCDHPDMDAMQQALYFGLAQQEREYISARTKAGIAVAKANGKQVGRAKGADLTEQRAASLAARRTKAYTNEENRKAFALVCVMGGTLVQKAEYLNANGFKTAKGGAWRGNQVKRLIDLYTA